MISLFGFLTSPLEWGVVLIVALLLFGNRLPSAMRSLGRGVTEFKKGLEGAGEDDVDAAAKKSEALPKSDEQPAKG
jgi:sec-independent protein translocase protein TatA